LRVRFDGQYLRPPVLHEIVTANRLGLVAAEQRRPAQLIEDRARVRPLEIVEEPVDLKFRPLAEVLVEGDVNIARRELAQRHIVLDAPQEKLPLEFGSRSHDLAAQRPDVIVEQRFLAQEFIEVVLPTQPHARVRVSYRMAQEPDDPCLRELIAQPFEHEVCADLGDHAPSADQAAIVTVDPWIMDRAAEYQASRQHERRIGVVGPHVLAIAEVADLLCSVWLERFEEIAIFVRVIDDVRHPGRAAATRARNEHSSGWIGIEVDDRPAHERNQASQTCLTDLI